ncbi:MAG: alpha/beta hydrolase [Halalkalicoccus sp.]|nr:alpha/beta hydrolase [Halalkalicoccus sp.]
MTITANAATADVLDHGIHYRQAGEEGRPVVLIHGVPTASHQWRPVQELLAPYLETYAIDLIGMGDSDKPLEGWEYTWENDARILAELMDEWGHEEMIVIGDDWGGGIALTFAALYPDRTDLCIAQNPVAYDQWPIAEIESVGRLAFIEDDEEFRKAVADFPMKLTQTLRTMLYEPWNLTGRDMREYREAYETVDYAEGGSQWEGTAGYGEPKLEDIRALAIRAASLDPTWMLELPYEEITSPTMILWGAQDVMMDPVARYRFKQDITNAPVRLALIEEAGHLAMVDQPYNCADAHLDFVTEHRGMGALAEPYTGFPELR